VSHQVHGKCEFTGKIKEERKRKNRRFETKKETRKLTSRYVYTFDWYEIKLIFYMTWFSPCNHIVN
jgi:hypothetical protein